MIVSIFGILLNMFNSSINHLQDDNLCCTLFLMMFNNFKSLIYVLISFLAFNRNILNYNCIELNLNSFIYLYSNWSLFQNRRPIIAYLRTSNCKSEVRRRGPQRTRWREVFTQRVGADYMRTARDRKQWKVLGKGYVKE